MNKQDHKEILVEGEVDKTKKIIISKFFNRY